MLWTDEEIVERVLAGETATYELIMRRYNQRLFRIVRSIVGDDHDTEDVLQEAYIRAYNHLDQFGGRARFSTWLTKIAVYQALAHQRKQSRVTAVDFSAPENALMTPDADVAQQASLVELRQVLTRAVDALPDELRTVLAMRLIEEIDTAETAECLDLTEANVKVRLHRARALLRRHIDAQLGAEVRQLYQFGGERCDRIVRAVLARLPNAQR